MSGYDCRNKCVFSHTPQESKVEKHRLVTIGSRNTKVHYITVQFVRWPIDHRHASWRKQPQTGYIIMSGYDCRNKRDFSFRWNTVNDEADV